MGLKQPERVLKLHCTQLLLSEGSPGVLHGNKTYLLQDDDGQITEGHSISAGLDYPGIGPEHSWLKDENRVKYVSATDEEALKAFQLCSELEGNYSSTRTITCTFFCY